MSKKTCRVIPHPGFRNESLPHSVALRNRKYHDGMVGVVRLLLLSVYCKRKPSCYIFHGSWIMISGQGSDLRQTGSWPDSSSWTSEQDCSSSVLFLSLDISNAVANVPSCFS